MMDWIAFHRADQSQRRPRAAAGILDHGIARLRRPSASAWEITATAIRSFMLPVGFSHSSFTKMSAQPRGTTLRSCTIEVLPIVSRRSTGGWLEGGASASGKFKVGYVGGGHGTH